jgi:L-serine dehydratase
MLAATPNSRLDEMALSYEAARGGIGEEMVMGMMLDLVDILDTSVATGLRGTDYGDRILGYQSGAYKAAFNSGKIIDLGLINQIIPYVTALMETKSSMGVLVAAPTAGSCGGLPGTVLAICDSCGWGRLEKARGLLAAGLVGACIASESTFSAEVCGCQAECGISSGMTAAAVVSLMGGSAATALSAASIALQNIFGMVCDPVANRVEVPCLGKNILAASNAMCCANMALAGFDQVIPFDETVAAMDKVGRSLPHELRCTALGGLSMTKTSKAIEDRLNRIPIKG